MKIFRKSIKKLVPNKALFIYRSLRAFLYGEKEIRFLRKLIDPKKEAIDIGANLGEYAFWMSKHASHVHAFEPHPDCISFLKTVKPKNMSLYQYALSSETSKKELLVPKDESSQEVTCRASISKMSVRDFDKHNKLTVETIALDEIITKNIGFIKIDIEGHEFEAIKGMEKLIHTCKPIMQVEIEQRHHKSSITEIFDYILDFGYSGFFLQNSHLVSIGKFNVEDNQEKILYFFTEDNTDFKEQYVNNFIFIPNTIVNKYLF